MNLIRMRPEGAIRLLGDTWYVPGLTNSGFLDGLVVDTGPEVSVYDRVGVDTLAITHGHADHFSSASAIRDAGAAVWASRDDARMVENPEVNIRGMFSWAKPGDLMVTKLFVGTPCPVDGLLDHWHDDRAQPIPLPGHTLGHTGIFTRDAVLFSGDALYEEQIWRQHPLPYSIDPGLTTASLELIRGLEFEMLVPGHGEPVERDAALSHIDFHLARIAEIEAFLLDKLATERTTEEAIALVSEQRGLPSSPAQYWLAVTTVKGYLGDLLGKGMIEFFVREHTGWWKAK
jgi:glyoxylase-like metal-dependent hydrolase (beta-lactamase superfamily II)